jgi:hypothetical protein
VESKQVPEELETVLRLVAEGHLTPEQATPIIEALTRAEHPRDDDPDVGPGHGFGSLDRLGRLDRIGRRIERRVGRSLERAYADADAAAEHVESVGGGRGRQLRIRVTEHGRQVVNLRIPIAFVGTALNFVPGLGGEQAQRIRDAVSAGAVGPIIDVEDVDGEGGVLISVE